LKYSLGETLFWISAYCLLALAPMALALLGEVPASRSFGIELGVMLGLLAYGVLHLQLLLTGRFTWFAQGFGHDTLLRFHRQTGIFALLLVLAHPATLFLADRSLLAYIDPRVDAVRAVSLGLLTLAALVLVGSSLWRLEMGLSYEWWRLLHGALSLVIVVMGVGHLLLVGHYSAPLWKQVAFAAMTLVGVYLVLHSRLVRPLRARRRPYRIVEVRPQRAQATTLVLEPENGTPFQFRPGQFVMLTIGDSPLSMQQHPFSLASSALDRRIELTAKGSGDFTAGLAHVAAGTRAWLEGPYGAFTLDLDKSRGAVFIAGGVGITPFMSMLRTYRDRGSKFPLILLYCSSSWDEVIFRDELDELQGPLQLTLVHVLQQPPEGWRGESGYLDAAMLDRHLPADPLGHEYFICGPQALMDVVEPAILQRGVSARHVYSERFDMV
jgi:predicted ferric reductase